MRSVHSSMLPLQIGGTTPYVLDSDERAVWAPDLFQTVRSNWILGAIGPTYATGPTCFCPSTRDQCGQVTFFGRRGWSFLEGNLAVIIVRLRRCRVGLVLVFVQGRLVASSGFDASSRSPRGGESARRRRGGVIISRLVPSLACWLGIGRSPRIGPLVHCTRISDDLHDSWLFPGGWSLGGFSKSDFGEFSVGRRSFLLGIFVVARILLELLG